jgi:hypothetical protein
LGIVLDDTGEEVHAEKGNLGLILSGFCGVETRFFGQDLNKHERLSILH